MLPGNYPLAGRDYTPSSQIPEIYVIGTDSAADGTSFVVTWSQIGKQLAVQIPVCRLDDFQHRWKSVAALDALGI
jgi:hypothetical protein